MRNTIWGLLALAAVAGCSGAADFKAGYDKVDREYRQHHHFTEVRIPRGGDQLYAREFGAPAVQAKTLVVMMHGFPDSLHLYDLLAPEVAAGFPVVTFDFLGWGDSDKPVGHAYTSQSLLEDLDAVIAHYRPARVVLVAHDASGPPAIDWALKHPQQVHTLVLLNTFYGPMAATKAPEAIALFSSTSLRRRLTVWGATRSDSAWQSGMRDQLEKFFAVPERREAYLPVFVHQGLGIRPAFFGLNAALLAEIDARKEQQAALSRYGGRVSIVFGQEAPYLNTGVAREFKTLLPNAKLHLVPQAAHYVQLDQPEQVAQLILGDL